MKTQSNEVSYLFIAILVLLGILAIMGIFLIEQSDQITELQSENTKLTNELSYYKTIPNLDIPMKWELKLINHDN